MENILKGLNDENVWKRAGYAYLMFFVLLILSYLLGYFLLPEGIMKKLPFPSIMAFEGTESFPVLIAKTLSFNLFFIAIIVGANLFRVRSFTFGYLPLYANTILMGLFAGTNSFSGTVSTYTPEGWLLFLKIGFLEFSAYILVCVSTVGFAMYHAEKWRGENFKKIRRFKDIRLSRQEVIFLLVALILLFIAAINEWKFTGS